MANGNQAPSPQQLEAQNAMQRAVVVRNAIKMKQSIFSGTVDPATTPTINIAPRSVGLLLGFIVEISGEIENSGGANPATRTQLGTSNIVQQFRFDDLNNYTRVQIPGWYLGLLNSARQGFAFGGAYAPNVPVNYGSNYNVFAGPASIAFGTSAAVKQMYYLPIAYSPVDLRGSIYMSVVNAVANLQITLNQTPFVPNSGNALTAVYTGNTTGGWDGPVTINVYQVYLDQIPRDQNGSPVLPFLDLNTVYDLKQTTFSGITAAQDFPMAYSNYRSFLSTTLIYDNGGTLNAGTDVNYFSLASANFTNIFKVSPAIAALDARATFMADVPNGTYYFESRDIPINTINYGNMELNINASTVNANARTLVGYESFALVNQLVGAGSLAGG